MARDYYEVLGIARGASADEIKKAYRRLSKELHPDKHKGDKAAEQSFKEINEAYEVLGDDGKRKQYDQFGAAGAQGGGAGFGGFDFSGFQNQDMGGFGDLFQSFFSGARGQAGAREQGGRDVQATVEIDLPEVVAGAKRTVQARMLSTCSDCGGKGASKDSKLVSCSECGGTGQRTAKVQSFFGTIQQTVVCDRCEGSGKIPEVPCPRCQGEGRTLEQRELPVDVPAGIEDGQTLRLRGLGEAGRRGAATGDLYVHVRVRPDTRFTREGADLHGTITLSVLDATLGVTAIAETIHGAVDLKIPAGTQPGQTLRIKGKGLPELHGRGQGDHFVTVEVTVPTKLSRAERDLLELWRKLGA